MNTDCTLDMQIWGSGSVAIWGAVSPVYDTTAQLVEEGVHVHARRQIGAEKEIDGNFGRAIIKNWEQDKKPLTIATNEAIYFMVAKVFGIKIECVRCPACDYPHLDKGWYSVNPHHEHLCAKCKRGFFEFEPAVSNPLAEIKVPSDALVPRPPPVQPLKCKQEDYPGGIQVWGTNPAIFWRNQKRGNTGIHVHAFDGGGDIDFNETVPSLAIDDIALDEDMVRIHMAQSVVPHLRRRVSYIVCPKCETDHFDRGALARAPHKVHICNHCHYKFEHGDRSSSIGNPLVNTIARLKAIHHN